MQRSLQHLVFSLFVGSALLQPGCQRWFNRASNPANQAESTPEIPVTEIANRSAISSNLIVKMVDQVGPSVVRINAARSSNRSLPDLFDAPNRPMERGTGSGFIFDEKGLILTNAHVVEDADQVTVVLKDGQQFPGTVEGADPLTDIAVIKIEANQSLPALALGNSDTLQAGDWAIAIGNPLGLNNTVTMGIISATDRSSSQLGAPDQRVNFIQTDAAINPGNSGGPLLNLKGEVIGINTAIIRESQESGVTAQGLGFAIPVKIAARISQQLLNEGQVAHPYLGIRMVSLSEQTKELLKDEAEFQVQQEKGVLVVDVLSGSPAEAAQLKSGDVIVQIGKTQIDNTEQLQQLLQSVTPGDQLSLTIMRKNQKRQAQLKVGTLQPETFSRRS
ncbi:trypsin-like peptidase domain-containing protein [Acaryochloris sp. IP29b_bin.137]|uniref:trypsin-like peptidase domain-containing protein n=1 Tax=Acaryochloris sp. IP29b_bin.137 TaxID=2969217 RepID=UPI0026203DB7|nr:trypsin-like peptidase domain-containing protein [Acaryochloris sp. IP29b_bin.137]